MTLAVPEARGNAGFWCALVVLCLIVVAPLTLADVPPLLDYPNHLARLFALAFVSNDPIIGRFYEPHWGIIPNLALDLTVPPLLRILPVHVVGRAIVGLILLIPILGAVAYHRALTGRLSYWPLGSVLFAYNGLLLKGFLNFIASVGLALLLGAVWVEWRERRPFLAILVAAAGAIALFFCHLIGLLLLAILIGGHGLAGVSTKPFRFVQTLKEIGIVLAVFAAPVVLYLVSDLRDANSIVEFRSVAEKAQAALIPLINYYFPLDLATALLCVAVPVLCLARRWCALSCQAGVALAVLVGLFLVLPNGFKRTFDLDTRFIIMASLMAPAVLMPIALPRRAAWAIGVLFLSLFGARMIVMTTVWEAWATELTAFRTVVASVPPGSVVMTVRIRRENDPIRWTSITSARSLSDGTVVDAHIPALLLIEHRAWWPFLFTNPSQQPIQTREPFQTLGDRIDISPEPISLLAQDVPGAALVTHVLVLGIGEIVTTGLEPVARDNRTALFRVPRDPR
jgi:hypothetical protein